MHQDVVRKMQRIAASLSMIFIIGVIIFIHGYLTQGWWLYLGLLLFVAPLPVLLALSRIWLLAKRYK